MENQPKTYGSITAALNITGAVGGPRRTPVAEEEVEELQGTGGIAGKVGGVIQVNSSWVSTGGVRFC